MIQWCKREQYQIQYSYDGNKNDLTGKEQQALLKDIQEKLG